MTNDFLSLGCCGDFAAKLPSEYACILQENQFSRLATSCNIIYNQLVNNVEKNDHSTREGSYFYICDIMFFIDIFVVFLQFSLGDYIYYNFPNVPKESVKSARFLLPVEKDPYYITTFFLSDD